MIVDRSLKLIDKLCFKFIKRLALVYDIFLDADLWLYALFLPSSQIQS